MGARDFDSRPRINVLELTNPRSCLISGICRRWVQARENPRISNSTPHPHQSASWPKSGSFAVLFDDSTGSVALVAAPCRKQRRGSRRHSRRENRVDPAASTVCDQVLQPVVTENPSKQKSCGLADVPVVETTDFWQLKDLPQFRPLNSSRLRSIAPKRQMVGTASRTAFSPRGLRRRPCRT
jgi:hypothetical protein